MFDVFYTGPKPNLFPFELPASSIAEADALSRTRYFWYLDGNNDYSSFDFSWRPVPWEADHTHVWSSQWQANGGTMLVPKGTTEHKWHWHQEDLAYVPRVGCPDIFFMDYMNDGSREQFEALKLRHPNIKLTRYVSDHLNVFKRIVNLAATEYVWIISSVCDYTRFDFTWHPAQWQEEMVHCFPSDHEKRGDTFYIHVESFKKQMVDLAMLDWFNVINYCDDQRADRLLSPVVVYDSDNLVRVVAAHDFKFPYVSFTNNSDLIPFYSPCLWSDKDRSVISFSSSNAICVVPRDVKAYLRTQIYDYPYLNVDKKPCFAEKDLDIVYISNGEPDELKWYHHTINMSMREVKWIRGINGRSNAYKAAAEASTTPWFLAVFAKLEVLGSQFNWHWHPDYFQEPKHYIFHARNPLNGLEYGHQAMIAYNKRLVLQTDSSGLDFTMSQAHEVVPVLCGTAHFNQDPWMTWRTAFREVIKLKHFSVSQPSVETAHRLKVWLSRAEGQHAEWCLAGAHDAVEYYESVNGEYSDLLLTYEWSWLRDYYDAKYFGSEASAQ